MRSDKFRDDLVKAIESAEIERLPETIETSGSSDDGEDGFMDIVRSIVKGETTPEEVEDRLITWANRKIDIPLVPERLERWGFERVSDLLVSAALEAAESFLEVELG